MSKEVSKKSANALPCRNREWPISRRRSDPKVIIRFDTSAPGDERPGGGDSRPIRPIHTQPPGRHRVSQSVPVPHSWLWAWDRPPHGEYRERPRNHPGRGNKPTVKSQHRRHRPPCRPIHATSLRTGWPVGAQDAFHERLASVRGRPPCRCKPRGSDIASSTEKRPGRQPPPSPAASAPRLPRPSPAPPECLRAALPSWSS